MDERKRIVAAGYDALADRFAEWQLGVAGLTGVERARALLDLLPPQPDVLELGIGAGAEQSRVLAERARLTGIEISPEQARRARAALPGARIVEADLTRVAFAPESFDAVVSFYALNHVPREELAPLFARIAAWLRPAGYVLASFGTSDTAGWRGGWLGTGTEMFFSSFPPPENDRLVAGAGLDLVASELETIVEPCYGEGRFQWVLARRPD